MFVDKYQSVVFRYNDYNSLGVFCGTIDADATTISVVNLGDGSCNMAAHHEEIGAGDGLFGYQDLPNLPNCTLMVRGRQISRVCPDLMREQKATDAAFREKCRVRKERLTAMSKEDKDAWEAYERASWPLSTVSPEAFPTSLDYNGDPYPSNYAGAHWDCYSARVLYK